MPGWMGRDRGAEGGIRGDGHGGEATWGGGLSSGSADVGPPRAGAMPPVCHLPAPPGGDHHLQPRQGDSGSGP